MKAHAAEFVARLALAGGCAIALAVAAIADTHPKDGDVKQAPLVSGGGAEGNRTK